jgi:pimeloyl-ACP methyl ester carboxylesterase
VIPLFSSPSAIDHVSGIEVPTLIIIGELDHPDVHQIADLPEISIEQGRKALVSQAGHMVSMEKPEQLEQLVINYLDKEPQG